MHFSAFYKDIPISYTAPQVHSIFCLVSNSVVNNIAIDIT